MTIALIVILAVALIALVLRERDHDRAQSALISDQAAERAGWAHERGELLTRIQRPDLLPRPHGPVRAQSPPEDRQAPPELRMVGRVAAPRPPADDEEAQEG